MIYIKDNFLPEELLATVVGGTTPYKAVETPGKTFWVKTPSREFVSYVINKLALIEGSQIENILCFFREAKQGQDDDWRIHNDSIIKGQLPDRAVVLYLSKDSQVGLNGTALWSHKIYGDTYSGKTNESFDKLLLEDSNDLSKWDLKTVIGHKLNRLVSYPCKYFHSKYPREFKESREVFVMFYKNHK